AASDAAAISNRQSEQQRSHHRSTLCLLLGGPLHTPLSPPAPLAAIAPPPRPIGIVRTRVVRRRRLRPHALPPRGELRLQLLHPLRLRGREIVLLADVLLQ